VGLDIGGQETRAVLTELRGRGLETTTWPSCAAGEREAILSTTTDLVRQVCRQGGLQPQHLLALGAGVQGIIDARTGSILGWPNTPSWAAAWTGIDLPRELSQRLGLHSVVADDSVCAMGVAAHRLGPAAGCLGFLYVYVGDGVGGAFILRGRPYHSVTGLSGEIGHVPVVDGGPSCSCGNRGCLEMVASIPAILRRVQERRTESWLVSTLREACDRDELSLSLLLEAARAGDKLAFQVLDEAGSYLGRVVATALNLSGVEMVVLGGLLTHDGGIVRDAVQRQVRLRALEHISKQVRIVYDDQGELAGARGAALLALDAVFASNERLQRFLTPR